jgi:hypothetical protein
MSADWTPVESGMPDDEQTVLVFSKESDEPVWLGFYDSESGCWRDVSAIRIEVTHWAPIPEGPKP